MSGGLSKPINGGSNLSSMAGKFLKLFALRLGQSAEIPTEKLTILHTPDIEFECPAGAECEVPLIAAD